MINANIKTVNRKCICIVYIITYRCIYEIDAAPLRMLLSWANEFINMHKKIEKKILSLD